MLARLPPVTDRDSFYSIEGTALHTVMEKPITGKMQFADLPAVVTTRAGPFEITQELVRDAIEPALDYWWTFLPKVDSWQLEVEVAFPGIKDAFGTTDVIGRNNRENITYIVDWKFGAGVGVKAVYPDPDDPFYEIVNEQLMFYAAAAKHTQPKLFPPGCRIQLVIVQPRAREHEPVTSACVDTGDLDAFAAELRAAVGMDNPPIKKGRWCRFQPCQTICPLHTGPLFDLEVLCQEQEKDQFGRTATKALNQNEPAYQAVLLDILDAAPAVENLIREARAQAHLILGNGGEVPGWKLVAKRGIRQWTVDAKELAKRLRRLKVPKAKLYDTILKSPAGVEKILPKKVKLPDGLAKMISTGTAIAPVTDTRPAVSADPAALAKILLAAMAEDD